MSIKKPTLKKPVFGGPNPESRSQHAPHKEEEDILKSLQESEQQYKWLHNPSRLEKEKAEAKKKSDEAKLLTQAGTQLPKYKEPSEHEDPRKIVHRTSETHHPKEVHHDPETGEVYVIGPHGERITPNEEEEDFIASEQKKRWRMENLRNPTAFRGRRVEVGGQVIKVKNASGTNYELVKALGSHGLTREEYVSGKLSDESVAHLKAKGHKPEEFANFGNKWGDWRRLKIAGAKIKDGKYVIE
jgi:hypothetical protein